MIKIETGNIFDSPAECLVNTVNCEGFMGKGIAYQFKQKYPMNNKIYVSACKSGEFTIGKILFCNELNKIIANFPTKNKWREPSRYDYISKGLKTLVTELQTRKISSIAIPPLGCGNGGLDWNKVKQMILDTMQNTDTDIYIYEPSSNFVPQTANVIPKMSASHLILMQLKSHLNKFNHLRLQKAAYFMNIFSNTDYFKFEEYKFGPYAHSIDILSRNIKSFQDCYKVDTKKAEEILYNNLISSSVKDTVEKYSYSILQSTNFLNSVVYDHELEVIATIVAIVKKAPSSSYDDIVKLFFEWPKEDKTRFSNDEIIKTIDNLVSSNILTKELIGFTLSDNIINHSKIMYEYKTV